MARGYWKREENPEAFDELPRRLSKRNGYIPVPYGGALKRKYVHNSGVYVEVDMHMEDNKFHAERLTMISNTKEKIRKCVKRLELEF